ncbi:MAG: carboxypeptidase-like regulatory domain-containing protein [Stackebrandtia sp.]
MRRTHWGTAIIVAILAMLLGTACGTAGNSSDDGGDSPKAVSDADPTTKSSKARGELTVTVVDSNGEPVKAAQVKPSSLDEGGPDLSDEKGRPTSSTGEYSMKLPPGEYRIIVQFGSDVTSEPKDVEIRKDKASTVDFVLDV